jgi:hypothetical protein
VLWLVLCCVHTLENGDRWQAEDLFDDELLFVLGLFYYSLLSEKD